MSRGLRRALIGVAILVVLLLAVSLGSWLVLKPQIDRVKPDPTPFPLAMLTRPIPPGPRQALLERGRSLVIAGDCVSCHTRQGGRPFEGGLGLKTPFGVIYSANLTGSDTAGLGRWSDEEFWHALSRGIGKGGRHLYPALPYQYFTTVDRSQSDAMLAYLKSLPPSDYRPPANLLPFPLTIRPVLIGWNLLFLKDERFRPEPARGAALNRGAALVNGLGHCGACHTPLNVAGSPVTSRFLQGAALNGWVAPDLTGNPRTGLGRWSRADIVAYLRTGRNTHSNAAGPMAEVVSYSTSLMSDADLNGIATYLKSLPPSPSRALDTPDAGAMNRGGAIYADACSGCHLSDGRGQTRLFPPLGGSAVAQQHDPAGILRIILGGARTAPTRTSPSAPTMPSFAWKLTDEEAADVATYVRNSWGNRAAAVRPRDAERARHTGRFAAPLVDVADRTSPR